MRDRDNREEDSHQVKHWLIDHKDMASPPKFKFKLVGSYQDPLTRQLAEAARIGRAGVGILNSVRVLKMLGAKAEDRHGGMEQAE